MPFVTRKSMLVLSVLSGIAIVAVAGFVWSGVYNVGADDHHTRPVHALMEVLRKRSIATRASRLEVPVLNDPARITQGAGNYDAMCTGCHLTPGAAETELSKGLYPAPPNLTKNTVDAAEAFWVIKHGVKASGMPAWGKSMEDEYIWNMVAFLQELPKLDAQQYQAMVDRSGGHSHGVAKAAAPRMPRAWRTITTKPVLATIRIQRASPTTMARGDKDKRPRRRPSLPKAPRTSMPMASVTSTRQRKQPRRQRQTQGPSLQPAPNRHQSSNQSRLRKIIRITTISTDSTR